MKVKVLRNLGLGMPSLKEGQEADVDEALGEQLIKRSLAVAVGGKSLKGVPPAPLKAVPPEEPEEPEDGTIEKAEADLKAYRDKQIKKPKAKSPDTE